MDNVGERNNMLFDVLVVPGKVLSIHVADKKTKERKKKYELLDLSHV